MLMCVIRCRVPTVTPEMSVNGVFLELMEIRYLVSPKQKTHQPSNLRLTLPDCLCLHVCPDARVTLAVLEDLVLLAHLESRDQR